MFWAYVGTFYLLLFTIKDFVNKMVVDDRYNYFMLGFTFALLGYMSKSIVFLLVLLAVVVAFNLLMKKFKVLGEADINSITWIIYGFAIIELGALFWFGALFIVLTAIYHLLKLLIFKNKQFQPYYYVVLLPFVLTNLLYSLY